jgi:hypothetical protein
MIFSEDYNNNDYIMWHSERAGQEGEYYRGSYLIVKHTDEIVVAQYTCMGRDRKGLDCQVTSKPKEYKVYQNRKGRRYFMMFKRRVFLDTFKQRS